MFTYLKVMDTNTKRTKKVITLAG